jgi:hypothetical protein
MEPPQLHLGFSQVVLTLVCKTADKPLLEKDFLCLTLTTDFDSSMPCDCMLRYVGAALFAAGGQKGAGTRDLVILESDVA